MPTGSRRCYGTWGLWGGSMKGTPGRSYPLTSGSPSYRSQLLVSHEQEARALRIHPPFCALFSNILLGAWTLGRSQLSLWAPQVFWGCFLIYKMKILTPVLPSNPLLPTEDKTRFKGGLWDMAHAQHCSFPTQEVYGGFLSPPGHHTSCQFSMFLHSFPSVALFNSCTPPGGRPVLQMRSLNGRSSANPWPSRNSIPGFSYSSFLHDCLFRLNHLHSRSHTHTHTHTQETP